MEYSFLLLAVFLLVYALGCSTITRRDQQSTAAELAARLRADPNWTARETARLRNAPQPDAVLRRPSIASPLCWSTDTRSYET